MKTLQSKYFDYRDELQDFVNADPTIEVVSIVPAGPFNDKFLLFYNA